jgi:hypothetical protein
MSTKVERLAYNSVIERMDMAIWMKDYSSLNEGEGIQGISK